MSIKKIGVLTLLILNVLYPFDTPQSISEESTEKIIFLETEPVNFQQLDFPASIRTHKPRIGLALSGGGARGFAQIGILKVLEKNNIPVDYIAGTSIGGIVGGLYAAGYTATELESLALNINWEEIFSDIPPRLSLLFTQREGSQNSLFQLRFEGIKPQLPTALTSAQKVTNLLSSLTLEANFQASLDFDRLKIPFRSVATDLVTGERVVIGKGDLATALRATMGVPLAFTALEIGNQLLVDGGLVDPIPVDVVEEMGADFVLAVNTSASLLPKEKISNPFVVASQTTSIMSLEKKNESLLKANFTFSPELEEYSSIDFDRVAELIKIGEKYTDSLLPDLKQKLSIFVTPSQNQEKYFILNTGFEGLQKLSPASFIYLIRKEDSVTSEELKVKLYSLYSSGLFSKVYARLEREKDGYNLTYHLEENPVLNQIIFASNPISQKKSILYSNPQEEILNYKEVQKILENELSSYHNQGYILARLEKVEFDTASQNLLVSIDPGIISRMEIVGNQRTKDWLITSNFLLRPGQPFNSSLASQGLSNLHSTGFFEQINLNLNPASEGVHLRLNLKEKNFTSLKVGAHFKEEYRQESFLQLMDSNIFGLGNEISTHLQLGERKKLYSLNFKADRIFKTYLTYKLSFFYKNEERNFFEKSEKAGLSEERRGGLVFSFGANVSRLGKTSLESRLENVSVLNPIGFSSDRKNLRSLILRSIFDTLDKYPYPNTGRYYEFHLETADKVFYGNLKYAKLYSALETYFPLTEKFLIHPKITAGFSDGKLPFFEKFTLGGSKSFSGYVIDEKRGDQLFLVNLEARLKTAKRVYWFLRYDIGNVWTSKSFDLQELTQGIGIKLGITTPLGPVELGYGWAERGKQKAYLNLGFDF